jgi:hypothetical protein
MQQTRSNEEAWKGRLQRLRAELDAMRGERDHLLRMQQQQQQQQFPLGRAGGQGRAAGMPAVAALQLQPGGLGR